MADSSHHHPSDAAALKVSQAYGVPRNDDWNKVQKAVTALFQQKQPSMLLDLEMLRQRLNNLMQSDVRLFIPQYYQEHLLKKGMIILREPVKEETGYELLQNLAKVWERFFANILPLLQAIFYPIESLNCSVRSLTLMSFRDIVVLKTKLEDALTERDAIVPPRIQQMLLVLQSVRSDPPSENFIKLESLVCLVVSPYLKSSRLSHAMPPPSKSFKRSTGYVSRNRAATDGGDSTKSPVIGHTVQGHPINPIQEGESLSSSLATPLPEAISRESLSSSRERLSPQLHRGRCTSDLSRSTTSLDGTGVRYGQDQRARSTLSLDQLKTETVEENKGRLLDGLKASVV